MNLELPVLHEKDNFLATYHLKFPKFRPTQLWLCLQPYHIKHRSNLQIIITLRLQISFIPLPGKKNSYHFFHIQSFTFLKAKFLFMQTVLTSLDYISGVPGVWFSSQARIILKFYECFEICIFPQHINKNIELERTSHTSLQ